MTWPLMVVLGALASTPGPCGIVTRRDVEKTLHWKVTDQRESPYHLPQSSGWRCTYEADEGSLLVVLPDAGSSFLQNNDLVDPFKNGLGTRVGGIADSVQIFDGAAYVAKHGQSVSVTVLPQSGEASLEQLTALARVAAHHLP